ESESCMWQPTSYLEYRVERRSARATDDEMRNELDRLVSAKAVAIVRAASADQALGAARAALEGGMTALEVTLNTPGALDVIRELAKGPHLVGAGTVLHPAAADAAIEAGARFLVSPHTDLSLIRHVL